MLYQTPAEGHAAVGILIAALGGIAVGVERQWSGHATGPRAHLGGIRTFALLGGFAGTAGWLSATGLVWPAVAMLAGAGYVARRAIGARRGYAVAGLLGGLVSSTSVTLTLARESRERRGAGTPLALGVLAASTVMYGRMIATTLLLAPALCLAALPGLLPPAIVGTALAFVVGRRTPGGGTAPEGPRHPLALGAALQMAVVFQLVLFGVTLLRERFGTRGVLATGAFLGSTDVDALVVAMASSLAAGVDAVTAARAIVLGALANTLVKLGLVVVVGTAAFRRAAGIYLVALAAATALGLALV